MKKQNKQIQKQTNKQANKQQQQNLVCMGVWEWMCEWMSLQCHSCAQTAPWSKMSRAWPPLSAITTSSGSTCPSHQESAWWAAEARLERVIVEVVRKAIVAEQYICICWTHLQIFSVSTVLAEKTSDVDQTWRASAKLSGRRLPPHLTGRGQLIEGVMFGELSVSLFVTLGVCMGGSVNVEVVRKGIIAELMLQYLLNTFTNVFY